MRLTESFFLVLQIQIKTINGHVLSCTNVERTGTSPARVVGTESVVHELGEFNTLGVRRDSVVAGGAGNTTDSQQDLYALGLAVWDVLLDLSASL
jgi:hypothetical protein